jgi:hypothetical protein
MMPLHRLVPALVLLVGLLLLPAPALARQATPTTPQTTEAIRVFLDCNTFCDFDHIRREITFVNWVRDRADADVHLIVTSQDTGGGREYVLRFIGMRGFVGSDDEIRFNTQQSETDDEIRRRQTQRLSLGLARYVARGQFADRLRLTFSAPAGTAPGATQQPHDPWNLWVFEVGVNGFLQGESLTKSDQLSGSLEASRVSEEWKVRFDLEGGRSHQTNELEDSTLRTKRSNYELGGLVVRSLGKRWSVGLELAGARSTRDNYDVQLKFEPGIEYNVFPYSESSRRQFVFIYSIGLNYENYRDSTIYDKLSEFRPINRFTIAGEAIQPWGQLHGRLVGSAYLDDFSKNRLSVFGGAEFRIARGLELDIFAEYSSIRDQLSLTKGGATDEEILLQLRQLRTDYRWEMSVGLSYTFGSKFSNTVNPRFGNSPGN